MLKPAYYYKEALSKCIGGTIGNPKYLFRSGESWAQFEAKITEDSWQAESWVSVDGSGRVVGCLKAYIHRDSAKVEELNVVRFDDKAKCFELDLLTFLRTLRRYRKVEWSVIVGNPVEKQYDRICRKLGGRVIGTFTKSVRLWDRRLYDRKWYEWVNPNSTEQ